MNEFLNKVAAGEPIPLKLEVDQKSAGYLALGIFAAIMMGFLIGGVVLKR